MQTIMSDVKVFIEPQDKSQTRYIHTVILRFDFDIYH